MLACNRGLIAFQDALHRVCRPAIRQLDTLTYCLEFVTLSRLSFDKDIVL